MNMNMTINVVLIRGYVFSVLSEYCFFRAFIEREHVKKTTHRFRSL